MRDTVVKDYNVVVIYEIYLPRSRIYKVNWCYLRHGKHRYFRLLCTHMRLPSLTEMVTYNRFGPPSVTIVKDGRNTAGCVCNVTTNPV